ncbi:MAG: hypothetical protein ACO23N_07810 [Opitutales bacterium]
MNPADPTRPPPWLIPFCASCKDGVEGFTVHRLEDPNTIEIEAQCHGKTEGRYLTKAELIGKRRAGAPIVMFEGPLRHLVDVIVNAGN